MIEYRIATEADVDALANMRWEFWLEDGRDPALLDKAAFLRECAGVLKQGLITGRWTYWVALLNGDIASQVFVQQITKVPNPSKLHDAFGYVSNVYTKPAYRGQGIGSNLLARVKTWAKEQDFEFLIAWPSEASVRFYERAGFGTTEAVEYSVRPYVN